MPALPIFDKATYDQSQIWIKDYINVPTAQMTHFTSKIFDQPLVTEPTAHTQELYAALDPVVQAVLTDKNADIDALLDAANTQVQTILDHALTGAVGGARPPGVPPTRTPDPARAVMLRPANPRDRGEARAWGRTLKRPHRRGT